jgi:hypothetical protein
MDLLIKLCKVCDTEKIACEFKKYRHVCRKCDSKLNNEAYREKFAEYYQKNKAYRAEYKREYRRKKKESEPPKKKGRPRKLILEIEIVKED